MTEVHHLIHQLLQTLHPPTKYTKLRAIVYTEYTSDYIHYTLDVRVARAVQAEEVDYLDKARAIGYSKACAAVAVACSSWLPARCRCQCPFIVAD